MTRSFVICICFLFDIFVYQTHTSLIGFYNEFLTDMFGDESCPINADDAS